MRQTVRFLFGNELRELSEVSPTLTVLNYLRTEERRCGTKEGCTEGDCGACTVVIGELVGGKMYYQAVNSCIQFMPTLDGKQLITVEHLKSADGYLHPAQQALVDCHGTQCGFCTPGFVMSLYALYQNESKPDLRRINEVLAGNLCRCTGYGPIIEAAQCMYDIDKPTAIKEERDQVLNTLTQWQQTESISISKDEQTYLAPTTVGELADLYGQYPEATLLAGGTDVGLWVTKQHRELSPVIYLGKVQELKAIMDTPSSIKIGAGVTYSAAEGLINKYFPAFGDLFRRIGSAQIRNLGTIGGNIANGSPIGDTPPVLIALNATLTLRQGDQSREIPLEDYFIDYGKQDLGPGEFVETVDIPKIDDARELRVYKISKRFEEDISTVCGVFNIRIQKGQVEDIRICYGGMAGTPKRATQTENVLIGKPWDQIHVEAAMDFIDKDFTPLSDVRGSANYRRTIARNLLLKFFLETTGTASPTCVRGERGGVAHAV